MFLSILPFFQLVPTGSKSSPCLQFFRASATSVNFVIARMHTYQMQLKEGFVVTHGLRGYSPSWRKIMVPGVSRCISSHKAWTEKSWNFSFFSVVFILELKPMGRCQDGSSFDLTLQMFSDLSDSRHSQADNEY